MPSAARTGTADRNPCWAAPSRHPAVPAVSRAGRRRRGRPAAPPAPTAAPPGPATRAASPSAGAVCSAARIAASRRPVRRRAATAATASATAVSARASGAEGSGSPSCRRHGAPGRASVRTSRPTRSGRVLQRLGDRVGPRGDDREVRRVRGPRPVTVRSAAACGTTSCAGDTGCTPATISPVALSTGVRPSATRRRARVAARLTSTPVRAGLQRDLAQPAGRVLPERDDRRRRHARRAAALRPSRRR